MFPKCSLHNFKLESLYPSSGWMFGWRFVHDNTGSRIAQRRRRRGKFIQISVCLCWGKVLKYGFPTVPFTNLEPEDQEISNFLCSLGTSCGGFWSSRIVKRSVGLLKPSSWPEILQDNNPLVLLEGKKMLSKFFNSQLHVLPREKHCSMLLHLFLSFVIRTWNLPKLV